MVAKLAVVDPPVKQRKHMTGTVLRLKQMMSSTSRVPSFTLPEYPPGVAPKKARMAMDESFSGVNAWGNQSAFAAAAAINYQSAALEGLAFPGYAFLSELAQRPEYRRISEIIATEMTRKWIKITSTSKDDDSKIEQIKIIEDELKRLNVRDCFQKCTELDGYFGRAHLYIDTGSVDDREELKTPIGNGNDETSMIKMAGKAIDYLQPTEPVWTYPTAYNSIDPLKRDWYEPSTWFVLGKEIHKTRLLKFVGRQVPDMLKPAYSFGGLSMSQMAIPYVNNWLRTRQSVADIIHSFSVFVLKTDLSESLSEGGEELFQRAEAFNMFRDNKGVFLLDKEGEDFANVSAPLGSLDHLQAQSQEHLSSVSGIPLVKLTGISPSGLNATSEFEMRSFYDWIHAFQEKLYRPNLTVIINMIQLSKIGQIDPDIVFEFEPLWSLDEKGQAEVNQIKSQSGIAMVEAGILSQEEERKRVATDPDSDYSSIDVEDVPELRQEEEQGLEPHGGAAKIAEGAAAQQGEVQPVGEGEGSEDEEGRDDEPFSTGELRPDYIDEEAYERNAQPDHPGRGSPKNRKIAEAALKLREKPGYKGELHDDYLEGKNPLLDKNILKERAALRKEATDDEPMPPVRERKMNPQFLEGKHQTDPDYLKRRSQQRDEAAFDSKFEESKHPRGQPGNAGQFGPGGGKQNKSDDLTKTAFPMGKRSPEYAYAVVNFLIERGEKPRVVSNIPLDDLRATQEDLKASFADRDDEDTSIGENPFPQYSDKPIILKSPAGYYTVLDGHNRISAAIRDGKPIPASYLFNETDMGETGRYRLGEKYNSAWDERPKLGFDEWNDVVNDWSVSGGSKFEESKHPRGQPGNAGQFGPGGGGSESKSNEKSESEYSIRHTLDGKWKITKGGKLHGPPLDSREAAEKVLSRLNGNNEDLSKMSDLEVRHKTIELAAKDIAVEMNFPSDRINVRDDDMVFELNGQTLNYAGAAYPDGRIELFSKQIGMGETRGVLTHEIMHAKFYKYLDHLKSVRSGFGKSDAEFMDEYNKIFGENLDQLIADDGVTDYSKNWWKKYADESSSVVLKSAIHETLAEMSRIDNGGKYTKGTLDLVASKKWLAAYKVVNDYWDKTR